MTHTNACRLALLAWLALPGAALAADEAKVIRDWGLAGVWAVDCARGPANDNSYLIYRGTDDGRAVHERQFGGGGDSNPIIGASIDNEALTLVVDFTGMNFKSRWTMVRGPDGRIRTISNYNLTENRYTVRAGKFAHNGAETPWQTKCKGE